MRIAIVSTNKSKYSETFIDSHRKYLSEHPLNLFDGYLPTRYSLHGMVDDAPIVPSISGLASLLGKRPLELEASIKQLLVDQKIELVLAEYGYDAYRKDVLSTYGKQYKEMFKSAAAIIGVSKHMVNQLSQLGCPLEKLHYIPYGIDIDIFKRRHNGDSKKQLVACGRFVPKKGPQFTIQAFAKVSRQDHEATLTMIGDGELLEECKKLAEDLGLNDKIKFTGALSAMQIADIYAESFAFVQHSLVDENNDSEGTPLAIMEAGAAALPVISTIHAGIPDIIDSDINGFLVAERDIDLMADKMLVLLQDRVLAKEMGYQLQQKILANYSVTNYIEQLKTLINQFKK
jgi:glycosyltransferase involved in cell wall biosynthesis